MDKKIEKKIGIIGLGYVGKPLAYLAAEKGYNVIGIDNNKVVIERINNAKDIPNQIKNKVNNMKLFATDDYSKLRECKIIIVCVPTPTKNNIPDLSIIKNVVNNIKNYIHKNCLIIVESTVAPGMTKKYFVDFLFKKANLTLNVDYELAYCPERIDPGNDKYWVGNINRVCGASSKDALERTFCFYNSILEAKIYKLKSIEEAELVKVWENSMRNMSIAQVNLLAKICDSYGFEIDDILSGLQSKIEQFGLKMAYPGIGPGGHCIPEDIHYLIQSTEQITNVELLKSSVEINETMPQYIFNKLKKKIIDNKQNFCDFNVLILGKSYKANTTDVRHSQAMELYKIIKKENYKTEIWDPLIDIEKIDLNSINKILNDKISKVDILILGCPHKMLLDEDYTKYKNIKYIVDCWNKLDKKKILNNKIKYIGVGK